MPVMIISHAFPSPNLSVGQSCIRSADIPVSAIEGLIKRDFLRRKKSPGIFLCNKRKARVPCS